jgi:hypothetical protein
VLIPLDFGITQEIHMYLVGCAATEEKTESDREILREKKRYQLPFISNKSEVFFFFFFFFFFSLSL